MHVDRYMENDVAIELEAMLEKAQLLFTTESCCIYKVPSLLRQSNEDAYTPVLVSIGPLHHGNSRLVIFIDCCFVIDLFLIDEWVINDDVIHSKSWMSNLVMQDLTLLENQIPFFVFEKIYKLAFTSRLNNGAEFPSFMRLAFGIFKIHNHQGVSPPSDGRTIAHFTDLVRYLYLPPSHRRPRRNPEPLVIGHSASELVEAGVKFTVNKHGIGILDFEFEHGILKIPHIVVHDFTEVWLRNIVALEQCHYPHDHYIADYVNFLTRLVNRDKDADVLIEAGIIRNTISGNDTSLAKLFNDVDKNFIASNVNANYLKICDDLKAYYKHPFHTKIATLKLTLRRDYFTTPWKTATSIAGIVLLVLTFVQTICSILQV
ncbi:UPF0481 protein [Arachis hypogaea]|nr:UPF0481 protein [Arachis hypogaea]